MDDFFQNCTICIDINYGDASQGHLHKLTMRPLKVRELPLFLKYLDKTKKGHDAVLDLIDIISLVVDKPLKDLPSLALSSIVTVFMELNFPEKDKQIGSRKNTDKVIEEGQFARMIDFLISQGHHYQDILDYTLPQFKQFTNTAIERLTGKRIEKKEPIDALTHLGIPIRRM
ncbi:MAG: hypothetical protein QY317_16165 [Candidatus Jettenia caeni]|nr:MAG: hypothetical protein QY317_16165 [Candidatus Jettenia caeni]